MSQTIDEKVISMEFDNGNFEKNVKTSMSTLDKLKAKLNFKDSAKGLEEIEKASNHITFSTMDSGLSKIKDSFSALDIVANRFIVNVADGLFNLTSSFLNNISGIQNMTAAWSKYEEQTKSVQSIVSAVSTKINKATGELYNTDDVYETIDKLSWYTDETSYNMEQMTNAISTFTSTGMDLKDAEQMVIGIANACALAGVDSSKAEHAFLGFQRAIGAGSLTLSQWNNFLRTSGITANEEFMQSCLDAAVSIGTLKKSTNGLYTTTRKAAKYGQSFSIGSFSEHLTDSLWLTTDVLKEVFKSYTGEINDIYDQYSEGIKTTSELISDYIEKNDDIPKWLRSFRSAQEATTYTQAIESVSVGTQSAWASIYKAMFGGYEAQRKLWTQLANDLYGLVVDPIWKIADKIEEAFTTKKNDFADVLTNAGFDILSDEINELTGAQLRNAGVTSDQIDLYFKLKKEARETNIPIKELIENLRQKTGQQLLAESIHNLIIGIKNLKNTVGNTWVKIFDINLSDKIYSLVKKVNSLTTSFSELTAIVSEYDEEGKKLSDLDLMNLGYTEKQIHFYKIFSGVLKTIGSLIKIISTVVSQFVRGGLTLLSKIFKNVNIDISDFGKAIGDSFEKFAIWLDETQPIYTFFDDASKVIENLIKKTKEWIDSFLQLESVQFIINTFTSSFEEITNFLSNFSLKDSIDLPNLTTVSNSFTGWIREIFNEKNNPIEVILNGLGTAYDNTNKSIEKFGTSVKTTFNNVKDSLTMTDEQIESLKTGISKFIQVGAGVGGGFLFLSSLKSISDAIANIASPLQILNGMIKTFRNVATSISNFFNTISATIRANNTINNIIKIAAAITLLSIALFVLAKIDSKALWNAVGALGVIILAITLLMVAMISLTKDSKKAMAAGYVLGKIPYLLLSLAAALIAIAISMKILDGVENVGKTIGLFAASLTGLVLALIIIGKFSKEATIGIGTIISLAVGLLIMALSLKVLSELNFNDLMKGVVGLIAILASFAILSIAISKIPSSKTSFLSILSIAISLWLCVSILKKLANLDIEGIYTGLILLAPAIILLGTLMRLIPGNANYASSALVLIAMAITLSSFAKTIDKLSKIDNIWKGVGAIAALLLLITGFLYLVNKINSNGEGAIKKAIGMSIMMIAASAAIYALAAAVMILGNIDLPTLAKGVGAIVLLLTSLGFMMWLMKENNFNTVYSVQALTQIAIIIAILVGSVVALALLDTNKALIAAGSMSAVILSLGAMIYALSKIKKEDVLSSVLTALSITVLLAAVAASLYFLSTMVDDSEKLIKSATALAIVIGSLAVVFIALKALSKTISFKSLLKSTAAIAILLLEVVGIFKLLDLIKIDSGLKFKIDLFTTLLDHLSIAMGALAAGGTVASFAGASIFVFEGAIAGLALIISGIMYLASLANIDDIKNASAVMQEVGAAIGGFFGNILGYFIGNAVLSTSQQLSESAKFISSMVENLQKFIEAASNLPDNYSVNSNSIIQTILQFGSTEAYTSMSNLSKSADFMSNITKFFTDLGKAIVTFSDTVSGKIDTESVESAANAGNMIAEVIKSLPDNNENKLTLSEFSDHIKSFGTSLVEFCNTLKGENGFDQALVDKAKYAGEAFSALANSIPAEGGFLQLVTGTKSLKTFGESLKPFAQGVVDLCTTINSESYDSKLVDKAIYAGKALSGMAEGLPKLASVKDMILGDGFSDTLENFGAGVALFARYILSASILLGGGYDDYFGVESPGIKDTSFVTTLLDIVKGLNDVIAFIPDRTDSLKNMIGGDNFSRSISDLGKEISQFAYTIVKFFATKFVDYEDIRKAKLSIVDIFGVVQCFINNLNGLPDIEPRIGSMFREIESIINILNLDLYRDIDIDLKAIASLVSTFFDNQSEIIYNRINTIMTTILDTVNQYENTKLAGENTLQGLIDGLTNEEYLKQIEDAGTNAGRVFDAAYKKATKQNSPSKLMRQEGNYTMEGLLLGLKDKLSDVSTSGKNTGYAIVDSFRKAIKTSENLIDEDVNPVITPVLDLSNIQNGANKINSLLNTNKMISGMYIPQYAVSGNGISINNTFSINSNNITKSDVEQWSDWIINSLDERLGRRL